MAPHIDALQPLYYYDHFHQMMDVAMRLHASILTVDEVEFIGSFKNLDVSSQCLYIRMYNRTRPVFHFNDLLYDEIGTCDAIEELIEHGYLRKVQHDDYADLLSCFSKAKLIELSKLHKFDIKSSWLKSKITNHFKDHLSFTDFMAALDDLHYYVPLRINQIQRFKEWWKPNFNSLAYDIYAPLQPDEIYVVIDVETTGMSTPLGRVTEIGAVKIQNGKIIGEWSSLINPDTHIPAFITGITGISNDMVKDAPRFHEIAEELEIFMGDSIFVAHNVNFDYGFISSEFQRVGRYLKKQKLCTVSSMREYYPGHGSYSLANLCKEYAIPLTHHHRALCDAHASAHLLLMINEKRQERSSIRHSA